MVLMRILLFYMVKCSLDLSELTMSYSYVKCFEGSVVWSMREFLHLKAILSAYSSLLTKREECVKAASQPPPTDIKIVLEGGRSTGQLPRSDGSALQT